MLFTVLKGLFFLERRLKGTMVWFIRLSSTGPSGAFWGVTKNRAESQPRPQTGPASGQEDHKLGAESWAVGQSSGARGILRGVLRSIISQSKREPPFLEPLKAPCAPELGKTLVLGVQMRQPQLLSHQLSSFRDLEAA